MRMKRADLQIGTGELTHKRRKPATFKARKAETAVTDPLRNQVAIDYIPLIRHIAQKIAARLPASIELDDLVSAGVRGLLDAIEKYDPTRDKKFKTYAEFRIRGSILDALREQDWVPRSVREFNKREQIVRRTLEQTAGRMPRDGEVATVLGLELHEYHQKIANSRKSIVSLDDIIASASGAALRNEDLFENAETTDSLRVLTAKVEREKLKAALHDLPYPMQVVLSLKYFEDLNLKEIGFIINVTESRVSQIHMQALRKIKVKLKHHT